ncbi:hypothetical protein AB6A40_003690 [Gnathostoma spinigerum]|uniref:Rho-GAP domain-containing protein n=1 Tax=Gnathostoma spinigerum TaxID=75299 RepID=A0ABD6ECQ3_9BILA
MTVSNVSPTMVICGNSDDLEHRYRGRIEKVKFGVPIQEAFAHDIPATLLVLLLKVNKDGPAKKDIWRAPGNQAQVRKLSHIMQHGRLVNIANFSVYTAASVIKKFLTKLPGGIFGLENEKTLFNLSNMTDTEQQRQVFCRVVSGLGIPSQHLLVLLFGTFHMISESAEEFGTKMSADALGISVAPSLFHTCIHDGQRAKMEDVMRFKMASAVISKIIANFGYANLFPRESYEFYARITGRTLRVDENDWRFKFLPPARSISDLNLIAALGASTKINLSFDGFKSRQMGSNVIVSSKCKQISTSVGEMQLLSETSAANHSYLLNVPCGDSMENARSLSHLDNVHMRQTRRMKTRSQWFFEPFSSPKFGGDSSSAELKFQTLPRSLTRRRDRLAVKEDNLKKFSSAEISESETASCEIQSYPLPCTSSLMVRKMVTE